MSLPLYEFDFNVATHERLQLVASEWSSSNGAADTSAHATTDCETQAKASDRRE